MNSEDTNKKQRSRRRFLKESVALAGLAVGVVQPGLSALSSPDDLRSQKLDTLGAPGVWPDSLIPYGERSRFETTVRNQNIGVNSSYVMTPLQDSQGIITPSSLHFIRRPATGTPYIDPQQHRLLIHGLVERPLIFTVAELKRLPSVSRIYFIECGGSSSRITPLNGNQLYKDAKTIQDTHGRTSCSQWTGVQLSVLLKEAGLQKGASWLLPEGADRYKWDIPTPLEAMMDENILVAYAQNGEALRPEQGYPLRLLAPAWEGGHSIKWLRRIKVLDHYVGSHYAYKHTGSNQMTNSWERDDKGRWKFVKPVKSVITFPCAGGPDLSGPGLYEITGLAWSGSGRGVIRRVEISTDGGKTYQDARLQEPVLPLAHTRFHFPWNWKGEETVIQSRATDETGEVQPTYAELSRIQGAGGGAGNVVMPWKVTREGKVLNAFLDL